MCEHLHGYALWLVGGPGLKDIIRDTHGHPKHTCADVLAATYDLRDAHICDSMSPLSHSLTTSRLYYRQGFLLAHH